MSEKPTPKKSRNKFNRNPNDGPDVDHMTKFRYIRTVVYSGAFTALDHNVAFRILERYGREGINNARASLRWLEIGTGCGRPAVIASLRRLVDGNALFISRPGKGTRPTEYVPNFEFAAERTSGIVEDTSSGGIAEDTSSGIAVDTSKASSGIVEDTKIHLLKATDRWTDVSEEEVLSAATGGLAAPAAGVAGERVRMTITAASMAEDEDDTVFFRLETDEGAAREVTFYLETGSLLSEILDGSPATDFARFHAALQMMGSADRVEDMIGQFLWADAQGQYHGASADIAHPVAANDNAPAAIAAPVFEAWPDAPLKVRKPTWKPSPTSPWRRDAVSQG